MTLRVVLWETMLENVEAYATDAVVKGDDIYLVGTFGEPDSRDVIFGRVDNEGNVLWVQYYEGDYEGDDISSSMLVDDSGFVYVAVTEQTDVDDYMLTLLKYDTAGNEIWIAYHDSVGAPDVAVRLLKDEVIAQQIGGGPCIGLIGGVGVSTTEWIPQMVAFYKDDGEIDHINYGSNDRNQFTKAIDIAVDGVTRDIYLLALADSAGLDPHVKLMKFDVGLNVKWVEEWRAPGSVATLPTGLAYNPFTQVLAVSATAIKYTGEKNAVALTYQSDSTFLWDRTITSSIPGGIAIANAVAMDDSSNVFITGGIQNGSHINFLTSSYQADVAAQWTKTYSRCADCDDVAYSFAKTWGGTYIEQLVSRFFLLVTGRSTGPVDTVYATVFYQQTTAFIPIDTSGANEAYAFYENRGQILGTDSYQQIACFTIPMPETRKCMWAMEGYLMSLHIFTRRMTR
ncbi:MAG: hypothetical protein IPP77_05810 [Bacteroidetes bacterium]|nr:hypothetical protein [Bacteroidota bacterium]